MDLLVTSFGSHLPLSRTDRENNYFLRMPPLSMSNLNDCFLPDYAVLLLFDRIILDTKTWTILDEFYRKPEKRDKYFFSEFHTQYYHKIAETLLTLHDNGFVKLVDFSKIISDNQTLLDGMLAQDLRNIDIWIEPLNASNNIWFNFLEKMDPKQTGQSMQDSSPSEVQEKRARSWAALGFNEKFLDGYFHRLGSISYRKRIIYSLVKEALASSKKRKYTKYREHLKGHLSDCLSYVNGNLVLSLKLGVGFYDWYDYVPFYNVKFLSVGIEETPVDKKLGKLRELFEFVFPEFTLTKPSEIIKILKDKRIVDLRRFVDESVQRNSKCDLKFANETMKQIISREHKVERFRKFISWCTMPIGMVPWIGTPLQKIIEDGALAIKNNKQMKDFRWFYLISEFLEQRFPP